MSRRFENLTLLAAVVLASVSALNIGGRPRPLFAFLAIGVFALVGMLRLRAAMRRPLSKHSFDAYDRAQRIQEERGKRYWR